MCLLLIYDTQIICMYWLFSIFWELLIHYHCIALTRMAGRMMSWIRSWPSSDPSPYRVDWRSGQRHTAQSTCCAPIWLKMDSNGHQRVFFTMQDSSTWKLFISDYLLFWLIIWWVWISFVFLNEQDMLHKMKLNEGTLNVWIFPYIYSTLI